MQRFFHRAGEYPIPIGSRMIAPVPDHWGAETGECLRVTLVPKAVFESHRKHRETFDMSNQMPDAGLKHNRLPNVSECGLGCYPERAIGTTQRRFADLKKAGGALPCIRVDAKKTQPLEKFVFRQSRGGNGRDMVPKRKEPLAQVEANQRVPPRGVVQTHQ